MKKLLLLSFCITQSLFGISPEEFPYKFEFTIKSNATHIMNLDSQTIETLNESNSNLIIINPKREIIPFKIIKQTSKASIILKQFEPDQPDKKNTNQVLYVRSPKLKLTSITLIKEGNLDINTKLNVNGYMLNLKDKRAVARNMTRVPSTKSQLELPFFRETYYPNYEIEIQPNQKLSISQIIGHYHPYALLVKSTPGTHQVYYGSANSYPHQKIHNPRLNTTQKLVQTTATPRQDNPSYNNPNKIKKAWTYPKLILLITVIIGLIVTLQWVKKRKNVS